ncbi:integrase, catalytic region, zinc finger, CCHC-type containing protein [Tanacetum coccineum]|uniref:Integrase, catalytic region, zinc finger, CCHC-type containing protein n=1 Tax=Tanacetum coccineum TaxID=301880 RepID=A0ABQ5AYR9_9ASTR
MEPVLDSDQEINANMVFMAKIEKVLADSEESSSSADETIAKVSYYTSDSKSESKYETSEYYDNSTNYGLFVDNDDDQEIFHDAIEFASENFNENHIDGYRDLLTNFVERFLGTVRFGNNDFAVIASYGYVVIGSMTIKKVTISKDENLLKSSFSIIKKTQVNLQLQVQRVRTDNGTEFKNKTLAKFFDEVGISQQFFAARTPQQMVSCKGGIEPYVNVNFDEISEMASKQFSLEPSLSNLNETGKSSNPTVSQVSEISKKDLEDLFHNFYDEYFDSSKITKSPTTNVETSNDEISSHEEVFHESSESFQEESSSSSLNDDVQQSSEEVMVPPTNTQSISNNMVPNVNEASSVS